MLSLVTNAQQIVRLADDRYTILNLPDTWILNFAGVEYKNPDMSGKNALYGAKLYFGRKLFNIEFFRKSDGKVIGTYYSVFQDNEYFSLTEKKDFWETYTLTRKTGEKFEVTVYTFGTCHASYMKRNADGNTWTLLFDGNGKF
jgi:hypothetical protein